jgi:hypothetical protein
MLRAERREGRLVSVRPIHKPRYMCDFGLCNSESNCECRPSKWDIILELERPSASALPLCSSLPHSSSGRKYVSVSFLERSYDRVFFKNQLRGLWTPNMNILAIHTTCRCGIMALPVLLTIGLAAPVKPVLLPCRPRTVNTAMCAILKTMHALYL